MDLLDEFNLRYPEFLLDPAVTEPPLPELPEETAIYWLNWANDALCPNQWGMNFRSAVLALAAVRISEWLWGRMNGPGSAAVMGPVASAAVGGESVGYGARGKTATRFTEEWLLSYPPYGGEYLLLREATILGAASTRTGFGSA